MSKHCKICASNEIRPTRPSESRPANWRQRTLLFLIHTSGRWSVGSVTDVIGTRLEELWTEPTECHGMIQPQAARGGRILSKRSQVKPPSTAWAQSPDPSKEFRLVGSLYHTWAISRFCGRNSSRSRLGGRRKRKKSWMTNHRIAGQETANHQFRTGVGIRWKRGHIGLCRIPRQHALCDRGAIAILKGKSGRR